MFVLLHHVLLTVEDVDALVEAVEARGALLHQAAVNAVHVAVGCLGHLHVGDAGVGILDLVVQIDVLDVGAIATVKDIHRVLAHHAAELTLGGHHSAPATGGLVLNRGNRLHIGQLQRCCAPVLDGSAARCTRTGIGLKVDVELKVVVLNVRRVVVAGGMRHQHLVELAILEVEALDAKHRAIARVAHVVVLPLTLVEDGGAITVEGATLHCWKHGGHGLQTYLQVVENSCNPGFVNLGLKLGKEKLFEYIRNFGFGVKTGVDLNGESSGILFNLDRVGPVELATTAFGQGVSVTPIQQITAVSAAINGGILYKPYIVKSLNEPETNSVILENKPTVVRQVISSESSDIVKYALESVVQNGTGRNAFIDGYRVGGKTGTAQKVKDGHYMVGNYITSFIGFLPADDPQIIVYVAVDNAKGVSQYGGTVAAPIARNILVDSVSILGIDKRDGVFEKNYKVGEKHYKVIPDVVGMDVDEARKLLKDFTLEFSGSGSIVTYMSPSSGDRILEGDIIKLYLEEE